jgi:hypothetical protein
MIMATLVKMAAVPRNIVQSGARTAAHAAVASQAHANANAAVRARAKCDTLGLMEAAASASKVTASANTLKMAIEEVIAALIS